MFRTKTILMLAMVAAMAVSSYCPAAEIIHHYRWPSTSSSAFWLGATTDGSHIMTNWECIDVNDVNDPDMARLTDLDPNSAFYVGVSATTYPNQVPTYDKGIRLTTEERTTLGAVTNTPSGDWYITAPFHFYGEVPHENQTMSTDPNLVPIRLQDYNRMMYMDNGGTGLPSNRFGRIFHFRDMKFQGVLGGWRPTAMHIAGKITLTGPTALSISRDGGVNDWFLDAETDASAINEIEVRHWGRDSGSTWGGGNHIRCAPMWFAGKWVLKGRMYAETAGCMGDADIQIDGGGTPGLMTVSGVPTPWIDRRSGDLRITAANAVSRNAKWTIDTTSVLASPATYGTATAPFTALNPQCPGGKVRVLTTASPVYVRELWVDNVQKANGTYYATDSANSAWFGTSGTTYNGHIIVTGGTTRNVTINAVLDPGALAEPNLTTYPRVGLTKAFLEGYALNIKADDPITTPQGTTYKFVNWTSSTGSGIANLNAAKTTLIVPTGDDVTVTAHYVIAAAAPSPADGAIEVALTTNLDWTPGLLTGTQDLYFGTSSASLTFIKHFADGTTHGATNGEVATVVGPLADTTTYYWRVDTNGQPGATWQFRTEQRRPYIPVPAVGETDVERITPNLSWNTGHPSATSWDVYFGTSPSSLAMIDPNGGTTPAPVFTPDVNAPAGLVINTTYYWRVDEHNTYGTLTGFVWNFTTRGPLCLGIGRGDLNADCKVTFVDFAIIASSPFNN